jgi:hypothetical protein
MTLYQNGWHRRSKCEGYHRLVCSLVAQTMNEGNKHTEFVEAETMTLLPTWCIPPPEDRTGKKTGWYTHVDGDEVIFPHRLMAGKDSDEITMVSLPPMIWQARTG